ncbi:hypothetical protein HIM_04152 [Hirsutella minnesotensis 3608]|uniref:RING-type E3 ubiquitin transferase n=1 Tax=Hirsutella minnesotensis 3608 TaxID=1043627 RepID=A0A0F7ZVD5_9HYPO|nr:hypothetical protein HIM_04152 [Hirsutella minnesotensis 3608]
MDTAVDHRRLPDDAAMPKLPRHALETPSICRICRGEGTPAEPLFFPCKCSGSIKYVHQDCLMEWLSHSQKKYCELCKTSFRFTKLYAPDMPKSLPVHVFVEHMAKSLFRTLLVWLRAIVTISVWACWLPYFMRSVWSFMFWVSDEGLGSGSILSRANETVIDASWFSSHIAGIGTCEVSPLLRPRTTSVAEAAAMLQSSGGEDLSEYLVRLLLGSLGIPIKFGRSDNRLTYEAANSASVQNGSVATGAAPSLLGDVDFLRNLTRSPTLNRAIVTVLEGQVITILVIVCFILVILVRDYVVQQQPELNMRAAFEEPQNNVQAEVVHDQAIARLEPADQQQLPAHPESDDETLDDGAQQARTVAAETLDDGAQQARTVAVETSPADEAELPHMARDEETIEPLHQPHDAEAQREQSHDSGGLHPSDFPHGATLGRLNVQDSASLREYIRIYRRAGGDSATILEILQEEGLENKLGHWIELAKRGRPADATDNSSREGNSIGNADSQGGVELVDEPLVPGIGVVTSRPATPTNDASGSKGKERAHLTVPADMVPRTPPQVDPSRRRAASDGAQHPSPLNPLGSNNWSFAALPVDGEAEAGPSRNADMSPSADSSSRLESGPSSGAGRQRSPTAAERNVNHHEDEQTDFMDTETDVLLQSAVALEPSPAEEAVEHEAEPAGLVGRVVDFMWGDLDQHGNANIEGEANAVEDDADDDPWVDVPMADDPEENAEGEVADAEAVAAGAGLDAEAMDDLEDFEGVMELIGMRGPIAGLFQNAIFCAVLVSVTIFACIFLPYNIGRISIWVVANPLQLIRMLFEFSKVVQDAAVVIGGLSSWFILNLVDIFTGLVGGALAAKVVLARKASWGLWTGAGSRVMEYALTDFPMSASEMQNFSAISHEALIAVKGSVATALASIDAGLMSITAVGSYSADGKLSAALFNITATAVDSIKATCAAMLDPSSWVIDLSSAGERAPVDPTLAYWPSLDRFWAILAGYFTIFAVGALYLRRGTPFTRGNMLQAWEAGIIDTLHQASGIIKVIIIISIEMLVFPLYCGLLLDVALLPLFENTTIKSRVLFTCNYPLTSVFVHWFVGTGYMFHFALFVSMCRKIMRPGVLYFIRDPDDPEFHPIRDVLERNLTTQLRKILFSAFVYGALVIVCLGGVVWSLSYGMPGVLPIHYSSNEPVLEFPVDLLFYNFLMPQAVKVLRPGDGLHAMYTWWFRKCARGLRLTYFLFGERRIDEEGTLQLSADSPQRSSPFKSLFLELGEHNKVVPKTWRDTFEGGDAKPNPPRSLRGDKLMRRQKQQLVASGQLVKSGRFVRAPASDRVKIPKGQLVFLPVSELDGRKDGNPDSDVYASVQYQMVYVPPNFRARVFLFILFIWLFAAVTGVGITIAPLALGRKMFKVLIPEHIRTNDIYAFSIGIYILGTATYSVLRVRSIATKVRGWSRRAWAAVAGGSAPKRAWSGAVRAAKLVYAYTFLLVLFPLLFSTLMELYITIPLHTYMNPPSVSTAATGPTGDGDRHTIRVIQAWTLGLLYLNLGTRTIRSLFPESRAALAVRTVVRQGWLHPDVGILTKAFVIPGTAAAGVAIFAPPLMARTLIRMDAFGSLIGAGNKGLVSTATVYRHSYPAAALAAVLMRYAVGMAGVFKGWKAGIRDEAYLIGERLHNFGATTAGVRKVKRAFGAGRARV